jgi:hypothetical protein
LRDGRAIARANTLEERRKIEAEALRSLSKGRARSIAIVLGQFICFCFMVEGEQAVADRFWTKAFWLEVKRVSLFIQYMETFAEITGALADISIATKIKSIVQFYSMLRQSGQLLCREKDNANLNRLIANLKGKSEFHREQANRRLSQWEKDEIQLSLGRILLAEEYSLVTKILYKAYQCMADILATTLDASSTADDGTVQQIAFVIQSILLTLWFLALNGQRRQAFQLARTNEDVVPVTHTDAGSEKVRRKGLLPIPSDLAVLIHHFSLKVRKHIPNPDVIPHREMLFINFKGKLLDNHTVTGIVGIVISRIIPGTQCSPKFLRKGLIGLKIHIGEVVKELEGQPDPALSLEAIATVSNTSVPQIEQFYAQHEVTRVSQKAMEQTNLLLGLDADIDVIESLAMETPEVAKILSKTVVDGKSVSWEVLLTNGETIITKNLNSFARPKVLQYLREFEQERRDSNVSLPREIVDCISVLVSKLNSDDSFVQYLQTHKNPYNDGSDFVLYPITATFKCPIEGCE